MIGTLQSLCAAILVLAGSFFALVAALGLIRLPDLYTRMHAASKAGTLGSCVMLVALAVHAGDLLRDFEGNGLRIGQIHAEYGLAQVELSLAATDPAARL